MTFDSEFEAKLYKAVYHALEEVGLAAIKRGPFFGIGESERSKAVPQGLAEK